MKNRNTSGLKRGGPGRKPGTPNKTTLEIREAAQQLFDPAYFAQLKARLDSGKIAPAVECKLLAYAYGEPKQSIDVSGTLATVSRVIHEHHPRA